MLRCGASTVNELASSLELTDNAVRVSLERDRLVRQCGVLRGPHKPHFTYELTADSPPRRTSEVKASLGKAQSLSKQIWRAKLSRIMSQAANMSTDIFAKGVLPELM